ncbi:MAG: serpin family protein [Bacillota bacterium]
MAEVLGVQGGVGRRPEQSQSGPAQGPKLPGPRGELDVANSLWTKQDVVFVAEFLETAKRYYGAEIAKLDFNDPEAPVVINKWVQDQTNGKIDGIIDRIDRDDVMFLINAIYFLGTWTTEFDKAQTRDQPFYPAGRAQKQVPMMSQSGDFRYFQDAKFEAIELPYGKDQSAGMYIFLPGRDSNLEEFQRNLNTGNWAKWQSRFATKEGRISLPRFSIEYEKTLNEILSGMGMGIAFQPYAADFSKLFTPPPWAYIGEVKHKAVVDVDERGTEAAVTSVSVKVTSLRPDEPFNMVVDRPFFFAIVDKQTGTVLFMGSVANP